MSRFAAVEAELVFGLETWFGAISGIMLIPTIRAPFPPRCIIVFSFPFAFAFAFAAFALALTFEGFAAHRHDVIFIGCFPLPCVPLLLAPLLIRLLRLEDGAH